MIADRAKTIDRSPSTDAAAGLPSPRRSPSGPGPCASRERRMR